MNPGIIELEQIEALSKGTSSSLNYRNRHLTIKEISNIIDNLVPITNGTDIVKNSVGLRSISFSFNTAFSNQGAIAITKLKIPTLTQIGLVACGIKDEGGKALLEWFKTMPQLSMICVEQNEFSNALKLEFRKFSSESQQLLVIV
jgi:hypothetical protein